MADITQKLGFDASQALETLNLLNQALQSLNSILGNTGTAIQSWNAVGSTAVTQFTSMKNAADAARKSIEALTAAQNQAATAATKTGAVNVNKTTQAQPANLTAYTDQIQKLSAVAPTVMASAGDSFKRSYANAVANLAEYASKSNTSLSQVSSAWTQSGTVVTGAANTLANKIQAVKTAHEAMAKSVQTGGGTISSVFSQYARMAGLMVLHQALNGIIGLFKQAVTEAIDFGKRVAEIGTISGGSTAAQMGQSIAGLEEKLLKLSNTYGGEAKDVAEAYYMVLSSQIGTASESMKVLEGSMQFGVATNTSMADSVKLVTAALNGWGLEANKTNEVTNILFKSVATGRFHAKELSDILGRVGPVAKDMGVDMTNTFAILDTMTRAGVKEDTAVTQLRGILTQLLKPTKELKDEFHTLWGVENAQQAIQLFGGLVPMLKALAEQTHGNTSEMAEFFKNVRALTGVLQVSGTGMEQMIKNFKDLGDVGGTALNEIATNFVLETPAKKAELAWTNLKNTMLKLATDMLPTLTAIVEAMTWLVRKTIDWGAAIGVIIATKFVVWVGTALVGAFSSATVAATRFDLAIKSMSATTLVLVAALAGIELGKWINSWGKLDWEAIEARQKTALDAMAKDQDKFDSDSQSSLKKQLDYISNEVQTTISAYKLMTAEADKEMQRRDQALQSTTKKRLGDILKDQEAIIQKIDSVIGESAKRQKEIDKEIFANKLALHEREFSLKMAAVGSPMVQGNMISSEAENAHQKATSAMNLGTQEGIDLAKTWIDQELKNGQAYTANLQERGASLGKMSNLEAQAYGDKERLMRKEQELEAQKLNAARAMEATETQRMTDMNELVKEIIEKGSAWKKDGGILVPKDAEEAKRDLETITKNMEKLWQLGSAGKGENRMKLADMLGIGDLVAKQQAILSQTSGLTMELKFNYEKSMEKLKMELDQLSSGSKGAGVKNFADLPVKLNEMIGQYTQLNAKIQATESLLTGVHNAQRQNNTEWEAIQAKGLAKSTQFLTIMRQASGESYAAIRREQATADEAYNTLITKGKLLMQMDLLSPEGILEAKDFIARFQEFSKNYASGQSDSKIFNINASDVENLDKIGTAVSELLTRVNEAAQKGVGGLDEMKQKASGLRSQIEAMQKDSAKLRGAEGKIPGGQEALKQLQENMQQSSGAAANNTQKIQTSLSQCVIPANDLATAYERMATASANTRTPQTVATGGLIRHLAAGGPSGIGTDTVPAMLTPGEFVMNSKATSRFFSQLVAMNSGSTPQGRATGGQITNFGDINVSVGGGGARQTAREIGVALRRELRRGTSSLS